MKRFFATGIHVYLIMHFCFAFTLNAGIGGYFCVPVADLLLKPCTSRSEHIQDYTIVAASPEKGQYACPRVHQGIFNERVTVIQEVEDEVQVALTNCFYETAFCLGKQHAFWALRTMIITDEELEERSVDKSIFPAPISFDQPLPADNVITLIAPWHDITTGITYSTGTRFKHAPDGDGPEGFGVIFYNASHSMMQCAQVPRTLCTRGYNHLAYHERQKIFVALLRAWATPDDSEGVVAYVWGGISLTQRCYNGFSRVRDERFGQPIEFWMRPDSGMPCSGFDCSGLILRAAQIAGLPYFFKNTTTIAHYLRPIADDEPLEEGDIIWCPGHVMVVSDLKNNLMIEARGYASGDGKVLAVSLKKRFATIHTYQQLREACFCGELITPQTDTQAKRYHLLKLSSLWCSSYA